MVMVMRMMKSSGMKMKVDEAQALARSCTNKPDFLPHTHTHTHGKCSRLHWCCCMGWCHCKYVYQPMTSVGQLPSTSIPSSPSFYTDTINLSLSLSERFLRIAHRLRTPLYPQSPRFCNIAELFIEDYIIKRINGKMCYVQRPPPQAPPTTPPQAPPNTNQRVTPTHDPQAPTTPSSQAPPTHQPQVPPSHPQATPPLTLSANQNLQDDFTGQYSVDTVKADTYTGHENTRYVAMEMVKGPKMDHRSSPSISEDSGINAVDTHCLESGEEEEEEVIPILLEPDGNVFFSPSGSTVEIIENIETTV